MTTKQDRAVAFINELIGLAGTLQAVRGQCKSLNDRYNSEGYSALWNAFQTVAQNTDGSLVATPDATTNTTHPINAAAAGSLAALVKAVTPGQCTAGMVLVQQLLNLFGNVAVATGNYSQTIDDLN
jgi:hypothetical protein